MKDGLGTTRGSFHRPAIKPGDMGEAMKDEKEKKDYDSEMVALRLIAKMVDYDRRLDEKPEQSEAERRHVAFLRAMRDAGFIPTMN